MGYDDVMHASYNLERVVSVGWNLFWESAAAIVPIYLVVYTPLSLLLEFWVSSGLGGFGVPIKIIIGILQIVEALFGVVATMGLAVIVDQKVHGHSLSWGEALNFAVTRWLPALWTGFVAFWIVMGFFLLFLVPGIVWSIYYYFFVFAVALRGVSGMKALAYSKSLVKGKWWRTFGYALAIGFIMSLAQTGAEVILSPLPETSVFETVRNIVDNLVSAPFTCMLAIFFLNEDHLKFPWSGNGAL